MCGQPIRLGNILCQECRSKPSKCSRCKKAFGSKLKGRVPANCPKCTAEVKILVGRKGSAQKSLEKRKINLANPENCKDCGSALPMRKTIPFEYCEKCLPLHKQRYEIARRKGLLRSDPNFDKRRDLKRKYGISLEEYDLLFKSQGKTCAICKSKKSSGKGWHTDHDHKTGAIRGILCHFCNLALGHFKDDPDIMKHSIKYLNRWERIHGNS